MLAVFLAIGQEQLTGYMCLNRVETADSVCVVQPFSPCLFQQNDLPGPNLFLKFWREQLTSQECWAKWMEENAKQKKSKSVDWPKKMPLFCRGCSDAIDKDIRKPLDDFPLRSKSNMFGTLIAEGMERFCKACRMSGRLKNLEAEKPENVTQEGEEDTKKTEDPTFLPCNGECKGYLSRDCFDATKMADQCTEPACMTYATASKVVRNKASSFTSTVSSSSL